MQLPKENGNASPGGTTDNSPAFQRRECGGVSMPAPEGRLNSTHNVARITPATRRAGGSSMPAAGESGRGAMFKLAVQQGGLIQ